MLFGKRKEEIKLGPQVSKLGINILMITLVTLCSLFFLLTIYCIIKDNIEVFDDHNYFKKHKDLFKYSIFDAKTACTGFVTLISVILVRQHFILGFKPRINYKSREVRIPLSETVCGDIWEVQICNSGLGAAIVEKCDYLIKANNKATNKTYLEVIQFFDNNSVTATDFFLPFISKGFVFPAKDERVLFQIKKSKIINDSEIYIQFTLKDFLGAKYHKVVYLFANQK
jgi:hypothetical protein